MADEKRDSEGKKTGREKMIMMVNGEEIEMCTNTLYLCNKRAQNVLTNLKRDSMETTHTLRLYWGDVVMLNIITNQMLQQIHPKTLARILRPTPSIKQDLDDYRAERKGTKERLERALVIANDSELPLDYSRELEKYYKEEVSKDNEAQDELTENNGATTTSDIASVADKTLPVKDIESTENAEGAEITTTKNVESKENEPKENEPKENKSNDESVKGVEKKEKPIPTFHETHQMYIRDDEEEQIDFSNNPFGNSETKHYEEHSSPTKANKKPKTIHQKEKVEQLTNQVSNSKKDTKNDTCDSALIPPQKPAINKREDEIQKNEQAFANFGELNLDSLFN